MFKYLKNSILALRKSDVPIIDTYLYHATPYPNEILEEGFRIDPRIMTFGMGHQKNYVSLTTLDNATKYANSLKLVIGAINHEMSWEELEQNIRQLGYQDFQIDQAFQQAAQTSGYVDQEDARRLVYEGIDTEGNQISEYDDSVRRWLFIKYLGPIYGENREGEIPFLVGVEPPDHLLGKSSTDVGVIEVVVAPVAYYTREDDERYIDPELLSQLRDYDFDIEEEGTKGLYTYNETENEWRFYDPTDLLPVRRVAQTAYDNTSGAPYWGDRAAGAILFAEDTGRFLVALRSDYVNEPGTYATIGGKVDEEEDFEDAVLRELREETGYTGSVELIPAYKFIDERFEYQNFIGVVPNEVRLYPNWESSGFEWLTLEELVDLGNKHPGLDLLVENSRDLLEEVSEPLQVDLKL